MEIIIKGNPKEIAALVLVVQERQKSVDMSEILDEVENWFDKSFSPSSEECCVDNEILKSKNEEIFVMASEAVEKSRNLPT